jgi:hypothetical protein
MADTSKKLSDTARAVLTLAATRDDHLARPPQLPIAAARQVIRSLLNAGLVEEVPAPIDDAVYTWRDGEDGGPLMLRATPAGLARVGERDETQAVPETETTVAIDAAFQSDVATGADADAQEPTDAQPTAVMPASPTLAHQDAQAPHDGEDDASMGETAPTTARPAPMSQAAPTAPARANRKATLRQAAQTLLDAWNEAAVGGDNIIGALDGHFAHLRAALATLPPASVTKQSQVLAMLRTPEGATVAQIAEAMSWAPHTVRGFFAGLKKRLGIAVTAAERVRQAGPNKGGAKGSFTIYRIER